MFGVARGIPILRTFLYTLRHPDNNPSSPNNPNSPDDPDVEKEEKELLLDYLWKQISFLMFFFMINLTIIGFSAYVVLYTHDSPLVSGHDLGNNPNNPGQ